MSQLTASQPKTALKEFATGMAAALFFLIEFLPVGILFGAMAMETGLSPQASLGMSALVFAGASQFLALTLLNSGATTGTIIVGTLIINLRHLLMSSYVASTITRGSILHRLLTGATVTDEGFALVSQKTATTGTASCWYVLGVNVSLYLQWQVSTLLGILVGNTLFGLQDLEIEAVLYALFIAIVILSVRRATDIILALLAAAGAVIFTLLGYGSYAVLIASLITSLLGLGVFLWKKKSGC